MDTFLKTCHKGLEPKLTATTNRSCYTINHFYGILNNIVSWLVSFQNGKRTLGSQVFTMKRKSTPSKVCQLQHLLVSFDSIKSIIFLKMDWMLTRDQYRADVAYFFCLVVLFGEKVLEFLLQSNYSTCYLTRAAPIFRKIAAQIFSFR